MTTRAWNVLSLAALMEPRDHWSAMLFPQLPNFSYANRKALRIHAQGGTVHPEISTSDINQAYIAIKLWLLLAQRMPAGSQTSEPAPFAVWNELWPSFESLLSGLEHEAQAGLSLVSMLIFIATHIIDVERPTGSRVLDNVVCSGFVRLSPHFAYSNRT